MDELLPFDDVALASRVECKDKDDTVSYGDGSTAAVSLSSCLTALQLAVGSEKAGIFN